MVAAELAYRRLGWKRWPVAFGLLLGPSILAAAAHLATVWGNTFDPLPVAPHVSTVRFLWDGFRGALLDFYWGNTHRSFWGVFGWMDTHPVFYSKRGTLITHVFLEVAAWGLLLLTLVRIGQVSKRLAGVGRRGRARQAFRMAFSHPSANCYFLFTVLMFALYVRSDNFFGAQGRNWLPLMLPIFWTALVYAPRAIRSFRVRSRLAATLVGGLVLYVAVGGYYSMAAVRNRFYSPGYAEPMRETPLALHPWLVYQMTWERRGWDAAGDDPILVFKLPKPEFVRCVRVKYRLTTPDRSFATFQAFWKDEGLEYFDPARQNVTYRLRTGPEENWVTVWVNSRVDQFRIDPDVKPCHFELLELTAYQ
jgi:hypothetical protein